MPRYAGEGMRPSIAGRYYLGVTMATARTAVPASPGQHAPIVGIERPSAMVMRWLCRCDPVLYGCYVAQERARTQQRDSRRVVIDWAFEVGRSDGRTHEKNSG